MSEKSISSPTVPTAGRRVFLRLAFVGTAYCGWQVQKNGISVQQTLQDAVEAVYGRRYPVTGCSRTDSGVHASCFCCTVDTDASAPVIPAERIPVALNTKLPPDITVYYAAYVGAELHARYGVVSKRYEYTIDNGGYRDPFLCGRAWHVPQPLDERVMDAAAREFIGKHDFSAFRAAGSDVPDSVRTVLDASVRREGTRVIFSVSADGFLYNMVRIMTGTLVGIARGSLKGSVTDMIESRSRAAAGITAPADGLSLIEVIYPKELLDGN